MTVRDELEKLRFAAEAKALGLQEWQLDAIRNEPKGFMQDIIAAARQRSYNTSLIPDRQRSGDGPRAPSGGGTAPISSPPGITHIDRLCDAAARRDRLARIQQELDAAEIEKRMGLDDD